MIEREREKNKKKGESEVKGKVSKQPFVGNKKKWGCH